MSSNAQRTRRPSQGGDLAASSSPDEEQGAGELRAPAAYSSSPPTRHPSLPPRRPVCASIKISAASFLSFGMVVVVVTSAHSPRRATGVPLGAIVPPRSGALSFVSKIKRSGMQVNTTSVTDTARSYSAHALARTPPPVRGHPLASSSRAPAEGQLDPVVAKVVVLLRPSVPPSLSLSPLLLDPAASGGSAAAWCGWWWWRCGWRLQGGGDCGGGVGLQRPVGGATVPDRIFLFL
jgi:hypothetical protein